MVNENVSYSCHIYNRLLHSINLIFFDVSLLYYSITINEYTEKFRIVFCCFSEIKNNHFVTFQ